MSTRCQVKVTDGTESLTLYHHTDGYPSNMLPIIRSAWEKYGQGWEGARVGKVASMLCAVDPTVFEPLDYHTLHGDIEYYYIINCKDTAHTETKPKWTVTVYDVKTNFGGKKNDKDRLKELAIVKVDEITEEAASKL